MSYYLRGDYYRGDYYRGDPGFLGSLFKGIKGAVGGFVTGGPLGAISGAARAVLRPAGMNPALPPPGGPVARVAQGLGRVLRVAGPRRRRKRKLKFGSAAWRRKYGRR